jgi:Flp pilus assembly protein TadB
MRASRISSGSTIRGVQEQDARPSILTRLIALVVLVVAAWVLLKIVIGIVAGVATVVAVVLALVGIVWALNRI